MRALQDWNVHASVPWLVAASVPQLNRMLQDNSSTLHIMLMRGGMFMYHDHPSIARFELAPSQSVVMRCEDRDTLVDFYTGSTSLLLGRGSSLTLIGCTVAGIPFHPIAPLIQRPIGTADIARDTSLTLVECTQPVLSRYSGLDYMLLLKSYVRRVQPGSAFAFEWEGVDDGARARLLDVALDPLLFLPPGNRTLQLFNVTWTREVDGWGVRSEVDLWGYISAFAVGSKNLESLLLVANRSSGVDEDLFQDQEVSITGAISMASMQWWSKAQFPVRLPLHIRGLDTTSVLDMQHNKHVFAFRANRIENATHPEEEALLWLEDLSVVNVPAPEARVGVADKVPVLAGLSWFAQPAHESNVWRNLVHVRHSALTVRCEEAEAVHDYLVTSVTADSAGGFRLTDSSWNLHVHSISKRATTIQTGSGPGFSLLNVTITCRGLAASMLLDSSGNLPSPRSVPGIVASTPEAAQTRIWPTIISMLGLLLLVVGVLALRQRLVACFTQRSAKSDQSCKGTPGASLAWPAAVFQASGKCTSAKFSTSVRDGSADERMMASSSALTSHSAVEDLGVTSANVELDGGMQMTRSMDSSWMTYPGAKSGPVCSLDDPTGGSAAAHPAQLSASRLAPPVQLHSSMVADSSHFATMPAGVPGASAASDAALAAKLAAQRSHDGGSKGAVGDVTELMRTSHGTPRELVVSTRGSPPQTSTDGYHSARTYSHSRCQVLGMETADSEGGMHSTWGTDYLPVDLLPPLPSVGRTGQLHSSFGAGGGGGVVGQSGPLPDIAELLSTGSIDERMLPGVALGATLGDSCLSSVPVDVQFHQNSTLSSACTGAAMNSAAMASGGASIWGSGALGRTGSRGSRAGRHRWGRGGGDDAEAFEPDDGVRADVYRHATEELQQDGMTLKQVLLVSAELTCLTAVRQGSDVRIRTMLVPADKSQRRALLQRVLQASRIKCEHLVQIQECKLHDQARPFMTNGWKLRLVEELCVGGSLQSLLQQHASHNSQPGCRWARVLNILTHVATGLDALHQASLVHGSLCLNHVFVQAFHEEATEDMLEALAFGDASVKLSGACLVPHALQLPARDKVPAPLTFYMAPEAVRYGRFTALADSYSFGVMMWELLLGKSVFVEGGRDAARGEGGGQVEAGLSVSKPNEGRFEVHPDFPCVPVATPASFTQLMNACLQQDPKRRPLPHQMQRELQCLRKEAEQDAYMNTAGSMQASRDLLEAGLPYTEVPL